jgi:hypothetical protein
LKDSTRPVFFGGGANLLLNDDFLIYSTKLIGGAGFEPPLIVLTMFLD